MVEKLADCTDLLARVEAEPETPERERLRDELKASSGGCSPQRARSARPSAPGSPSSTTARLRANHPMCTSRTALDDAPNDEGTAVFFTLSSWQLGLILAVIMFGATIVGLVIGRILSHHAATLREPFGAVQAALLTLVGLVLAFGLAMAVGRYDSRRAAVVDDANAIGTAYLRAQLLAEPVRSRSLPLFVAYTDASLALSRSVPNSADAKRAIATESGIQRRLWSLTGTAVDAAPTDSAPRVYIESLNAMIDMQTTRVSALNNRVPPRSCSSRCWGPRPHSR